MGYISNFIVYVLAMTGVMVLALFVFKHATGCKFKSSASKFLKITDSLSLNPRKTLYVVSTGSEKFLIAADADRTTLISKLDTNNENIQIGGQIYDSIERDNSTTTFKDTVADLSKKRSYIDRTILGITSSKATPYDSVMKSLAEKIKG